MAIMLLIKSTLVVLDHVDEIRQSFFFDDGNGSEVTPYRLQNRRKEKININYKTLQTQDEYNNLGPAMLRGVEWVHGLFLFPLVLGKM